MPLRSNFEPGTSRWAITAIRAIRAQNANIPISECSACELPQLRRRGTPANYENISQVLAAMETIGPDGGVALYDAAK